MPDTARSLSQLLNNFFQDNQADSSITAQDMRDLIVSLTPTSAAAHFTNDAVFTVAVPSTWYSPSSGTSEIINSTSDIDMPQNGRLRYIGTTDRHFLLSVSISAIVASNNQDCHFRLTRNGVAIDDSTVSRTWATGSDEGSLSIVTGLILSPNDYIELEASNDSGANDITIVNGVITIHGHIS